MRLGQLARKLAIPPSEISDFLASQGMTSVEGSNTRLTDEQLTIVLQRFAPGGLPDDNIKIEEPVVVVEEPVAVFFPATPVDEIVADVVEVEKDEPVLVLNTNEDDPFEEKLSESETTDRPEVIKAQKVALSGLKVLGKIELPEPKKKVIETPTTELPEASTEGTTEVTAVPAKENNRPAFEKRKPQPYKRERREQRPAKNPIALAREREMQAAEEKKREEEKRRKEQRTLNYQNRVKAAAPTKAARLIDEDVEGMSDADLKSEPKTWVGKFWRWFTT
jgi:hypothetical protein